MSTNTDIARIFDEMAAILELQGASVFRINAYANAARALKELTVDVATIADDKKKLTALDDIGDGTARKIMEFVETGTVAAHRKMLEAIPPGLPALLSIAGLGPKTVKLLWEQGGVTDLETLTEKIESGELEGLPRMGAKTLSNIAESIEFARRSSGRGRLGQTLPVAELIVARLMAEAGTLQAAFAGSLRRGCETIGDIDVLATTRDPEALGAVFRALPGVERVLVAGPTKSSVRLESGIQVDLRVVDETCFGAALLYFTGSKQHNVALRERAVRSGRRLNEYGLFPDDGETEPPQTRGVEPVAAATEAEIYAALELPWIPPELREDRGELAGTIPDLIELGDVKAELHAHTMASDGRLTIEQLAGIARGRGFHTIAVTDHSPSSAQAGGLDPDRLRAHVDAVREADAAAEGIRILAGSEVDILADGSLDYDDEVLALLDIVVASPHVALRQDRDAATRRLLAAIRHPLVHVIGHPTGRVINRREGLDPDIGALARAAAEHDVALEINANPMRLDLRDIHVRAALEAGALIAIDTDAHGEADFDLLRYGVLTGRRGWLTADRCVNCWSAERLVEWLGRKR